MAELPYVTILVSGDDACDFLQAQLTQDVMRLDEKNPGPDLSAWCNPKGRVICIPRVSWTPDGYALALPEELAQPVADRLAMFRFRSKVAFEIRPARRAELPAGDDFDRWMLDNLHAGIAHVGAAETEKYTAHMLNLDLLAAVSLEKGCYPGQEIIARTHYRGATKRRLFRFESAQPVDAGATVSDGRRDVGDVVNAIGNDLLAVVPVDAAGGRLSVGDSGLERRPLPYEPRG